MFQTSTSGIFVSTFLVLSNPTVLSFCAMIQPPWELTGKLQCLIYPSFEEGIGIRFQLCPSFHPSFRQKQVSVIFFSVSEFWFVVAIALTDLITVQHLPPLSRLGSFFTFNVKCETFWYIFLMNYWWQLLLVCSLSLWSHTALSDSYAYFLITDWFIFQHLW